MGAEIRLSDFLRAERERRGVSLEQVASATKIGIRQLHFLETGQYSALPAKPFVRGFVGSYCRFVGLDAQEVLTRFGQEIEEKALERQAAHPVLSGYAFERKEGDQGKAMLWVVLGVFAVLGSVLLVVFKPSFKGKKPSHLERLKNESAIVAAKGAVPKPSPSVSVTAKSVAPAAAEAATEPLEEKKVAESTKPRPEPSTRPDPLNSGAGLAPGDIHQKIIVKALADLWVRYRVDDRPAMRIIVRKDRVLVLRARELTIVQTSDPSQTQVTWNGKKLSKLSEFPGLVERQGIQTAVFPQEQRDKTITPFPGAGAFPPIPASPTRISPSPRPPQPKISTPD